MMKPTKMIPMCILSGMSFVALFYLGLQAPEKQISSQLIDNYDPEVLESPMSNREPAATLPLKAFEPTQLNKPVRSKPELDQMVASFKSQREQHLGVIGTQLRQKDLHHDFEAYRNTMNNIVHLIRHTQDEELIVALKNEIESNQNEIDTLYRIALTKRKSESPNLTPEDDKISWLLRYQDHAEEIRLQKEGQSALSNGTL